MLSDNETVISAGKDKYIVVFNIRSGIIVKQFKAHSDVINALIIHHKETFLVSASEDNTIKFWERQMEI